METLASILETIMLLCFGCSWPLSLRRNIKAKTAKSMSLGFIILIISGYVAGIIAKFVTVFALHKAVAWYVFVVYFFNLIVVSANLVVYFFNRNYDRQAGREALAASVIYKVQSARQSASRIVFFILFCAGAAVGAAGRGFQ